MAKMAVVVMMLVVALALALDVAYYMHGSLELYPTEEKQDTVRGVTRILALFLALVQLGLGLLLRRLARTPAPHRR